MLLKVGGCAAGVPIYFLAKAACHLANLGRARHRLPAGAEELVRRFLPELHLERVRCCYGASLPPNWWPRKRHRIEGMTFGNTIFLRGSGHLASRAGLALLLHELVHVDQVRRAGGEIAFACRYGSGFLTGGGYHANPLEQEAYDMVARLAASLPDGLSA